MTTYKTFVGKLYNEKELLRRENDLLKKCMRDMKELDIVKEGMQLQKERDLYRDVYLKLRGAVELSLCSERLLNAVEEADEILGDLK